MKLFKTYKIKHEINIARHVNEALAEVISELRVNFTPSLEENYPEGDSRRKYMKGVPAFSLDYTPLLGERVPGIAAMPLKSAIINWVNEQNHAFYYENLEKCADALDSIVTEFRERISNLEKEKQSFKEGKI